MAPLRWGVLGVSGLVGRRAVLPALAASPTASLKAIASRDPARAEAEAQIFGAERAYGSYEALLADPEVEAIYIPLPNGLHCEWTLKAAAAGKHVLCEKPLACNAEEAWRMSEACRQAGVQLMEAYMTS
ncbi:MAG TPA: Gfo/Idh/MocA family oxidoreductase, partial [Dehalococcoidia bacterium]|nr:Gfo/Idh/MocA family oxidoreductase [Dehalococcoidia bacterium]